VTDTRTPSTSAGPLGFLKRTKAPTGELDGVLDAFRRMYPKVKTTLIERAYEVAKRQHDGQRRLSGDPYITHPVAVALIVAEMGLPETVIAAALLHDTVEDTGFTVDQLRIEFGDEIAMIVDGVT